MYCSTLLLVFLGFSLSACKATEQDTRQLEVLYKNQQCPVTAGDLTILPSQAELEKFIGRAVGLGVEPQVPVLNYPDQIAVVVSLGQKSTAGYSIGLASTVATVTGGALVFDITSSEPREMSAQVLTSPCLVINVDVRGVKRIKRSDTGTGIDL